LTKEESSDDSTIISSQGSTLTRRNMDVMSLQVFEDLDEADIVIPSEPAFETVTSCAHKAFMKPKKAMDSKETNTECVFVKPPTSGGGQSGARPKVKDLVKRSKTFNYNSKANEVEGKANYNSNVKLNRSDSDGAMPLYRKLPFQHNLNERRSLRLPTKFNILPNDHHKIISGGKKSSENQALEVTKLQLKRSRRLARTKEHVMETPLDLELDLAAQKTKLELLQSDIARLREIQCKLEEAKSQHSGGGTQMDSWLVDHEYDEYLQNLLSKIDQLQNKTKEEKQLEKMIRKTGKEIHRLRKAKLGQNELDKHMFQEKLTFLTASKVEVVPPLNLETESSLICNSRSSTLKHVDNHGGGPSQASMIQSMVLVSGCHSEESAAASCDIDSSPSSSTCSTPTPHLNKKTTSSENTEDDNRFSYEIDPDIGVIV